MPRRGYRKAEADRRVRTAKTLLTASEAAHLEQAVAASGVRTEAEYIRRLITGARIPVKRTPERAELLRILAGIGTNLNQLARIANSGGRVAEIDLQAALDAWRAVAQELTLRR